MKKAILVEDFQGVQQLNILLDQGYTVDSADERGVYILDISEPRKGGKFFRDYHFAWEEIVYETNIKDTILFQETNPDKDIIVLHDGSFIIVNSDKLLSDPEGYDFSYDNHKGNVKARKMHVGAFELYETLDKIIILTQEFDSLKYVQSVSKETFDTPISKRIRPVKW
ncbi:hypothetical protein LKI_01825 [Leuconostoc kimchii IMSNU 11154]|uniref:Uncharacterized protein n=1 Tax=Leuconostoc kimchii (strain IMSNU 11154 / KCTC 2386 / IH25) TaxID=762051 RepID=D5T0V9_LEUKI|nr:hypothetical protein [Leuconostoc kimchii]ADG39908.1 hypothetical protein LKI_01825 [Leuconostoc kimchii IMSNU 11154]